MHNNNVASTVDWLTYSALPALKTLDISQNRVRNKMTNVAWTNALTYVNISRNYIEHLTMVMPRDIGEEPTLKLVDATYNQITVISIIDELKSAQGVQISLYLGNNPFHCDCNLVWLRESITSQRSSITNSYVILDPDKLYCETLLRHEPGLMKDIKPNDFLCEYNVSCPQMCTCYESEKSYGRNIVDCKGNNITPVSKEIANDCTALDISSNVIGTLQSDRLNRLSQ